MFFFYFSVMQVNKKRKVHNFGSNRGDTKGMMVGGRWVRPALIPLLQCSNPSAQESQLLHSTKEKEIKKKGGFVTWVRAEETSRKDGKGRRRSVGAQEHR